MQYVGSIYRPPSEAYSLIVQVTVGCTHNGCTFCSMYKEKDFRIKPFETVLADLYEARQYYKHVRRIFFADGDAMCINTDDLLRLLNAVRDIFPECSRVGAYSRSSQILTKDETELRALHSAGLGIVYIGAESGSNEVLCRVNKGETSEQMVRAVQKAESVGIKTSVTFISGLGGSELMTEHAVKTGEIITAMGASYVGLLTLLVDEAAPIFRDIQTKDFKQLHQSEVMDELEVIIENTYCVSETVFRSNHASNWLVLSGTLPQDKGAMLEQIRAAKGDNSVLRGEWMRRL